MLRSQKDVDKHVQDIFRKITNEKERNLRCYNVAKLYQKVGDYQSTKQYVELYLRDRPKVAGAHKLLGQALEGLKEYPKALEEYKCSLTLESRQPDLVLKVCELLVETKTRINAGEAKYWLEKAEEVADNHQVVFRLKEYLLKMENGSGDHTQLAQLIEREIEARPLDHVPRIRLLNLYLDSKKVIDAYKYAIELESRNLFRDNLQWYTCIVEVIKAYQRESSNLNGEFYVHQLSILERFVSLCFRDQSKYISNALYTLDQACYEAFKYSQKDGDHLLVECLRHVGGQLCFHLATAWLRIGKQSRNTGWKECMPYAWALLALAYSPPTTGDLTSQNAKDKNRRHMKLWKEDAAFRCTQAGHILLSMAGDQQLERFSQCNSGSWRGKVFSMLFPVQMKNKPDSEKSSFFTTNDCFANIPEVSPSYRDIALHDEIGQHHRPDSLHALVWLGLRHLEPTSKNVSPFGIPYILPYKLSPSFACHVFEEMKLSTINLETGGVETLSRLDIDTFLYASVFCAAAAQDERSFWGEGRPSVLPVDLTETLCTEAQSKWWLNTYKLHSNKSRNDIGEVRMIVSRGLEVVRLLGNHGMDVRLVVLLAKVFTEKASSLITPKDNVPDISKRAQMFWQCAITLLERMERNQALRVSGSPMFIYGGKDLTPSEIKMLLEEGRFFMACRLMKEDKYEEAIKAFQDLKNPYASFYEGLMYKKLADAELMSFPNENVSSDMKSNYIILLQKSLSALHLTLDRLRSPQNAGNHPLNLELEQHLQEVENCLMREDSNFVSAANRNSHDHILDDSFTSNRFEDSIQNASRFVNTSMQYPLHTNVSRVNGQGQGLTSTPFKGKRNIDTTTNLDASQYQRLEARPSPERLDAQMRRMTITTDAVMQVVVEQNRQMLDLNKNMMDTLQKTQATVEDLQKQMSDLKLEVGKLKAGDSRGQSGRNVDYSNIVSRGAEECDYDVAASQFHPTRGYPPTASYAHFPGQSYTYDNCTAANNVQMSTMLHQTLFPQAQMPLSRNMDPNLLLASYYPQAIGHNFSDRQAGVPIAHSMPGQIATPAQSNVQVAGLPASADTASVDSYRKTSLMGTPIISHHPIDLCTSTSISSASQSSLPTVDLSAQRFNMGTQPGLPHGGKATASTVDAVPHNFQISMPPQATIPTTESLEKSLSPLKPISTDSILPNVPMPTYSAVSTKGSDLKVSRHSTGSGSGNDTFTEDADYNPCADFKPIIPLPEEITVTTGEEDETVLFVRRAKLFRFVAGEWKERGVGDIKILKHNITGKPRVLMRREQVHKICANHFILPEMELSPQKGSDSAWNWGANDFSDGEARIEKLCVRFKTVQDAEQFKVAFDDARKLAKNATPVKGAAPAVSKPEGKTTTPAPAAKVELGGFSFISPPVLKPVERQVKASPGKDKENVAAVSKPSPFAGFSFTPTTTNAFGSASGLAGSSFVSTSTTSPRQAPAAFGSVSSSNSSTTLFGQKVSSSVTSSTTALTDKPIFNNTNSLLDFAAIAAQNKGSEVGKKDSNFRGFAGAGSKVFGGPVSKVSEGNVSSSNDSKSADQDTSADADEFEPTAVFNPVVPLPSLVEVRTGEEDEEELFAERAKLLRFDAPMKEWKERGVGKMKVLKNPSTGKVRLLMRREQVLKVCCNHFITKDLQFIIMATSDKAITWSAQDFAEGEVSVEVFALRFKTPELMHAFKDVVESVQSSISDSATSSPASVPKPLTKKDAQPLSELFKPKEGSWECASCYTRNGAEITSCLCCAQPKPGCEVKVAESKPSTTFSFGIKTNSTDDAKSTTGFTFGNKATASKDKPPPLSELFKPEVGSWDCAGCYTRNTATQLTCPCCSQPKPGSEVNVAESKSSQNTSFSFGIKTASSDQPKLSSGFAFGNIATEAKDKTPLAELFKPKEGSWSCDACYTRCEADKTACVACEAPKPGHENDKKASGSTFSFGMPSAPSASFSFGAAPAGEAKSSFSFGLPTSTDAGKGFSFGAGTQPTSASSSGFTFGASTLTSIQPSFASLASSQPSFGSPHKFEFHMKAQSPSKSPGKSPGAPSGEEDSDDDNVEENPDVGDFKPVVPLPDKVPVVTGEEEETVLYSHRAKLYRFASGIEGVGEWKERGLGDIKVLSHIVTNKPRLLMRREQVLKICLNHYIPSDLELTRKDEKTWMWHAQDFSEGVLTSERFACRFKTAEIAADFAAAVEEAKKLTVLPSPGANTTPFKAKDDSSSAKGFVSTKNIPNAVGSDRPGVVRSLFGSNNESSSASDEVEVVYEAKVTPEEKSAALKLLLPENFYRYKQAPPCEGCPGCEKDSDSDQGDKQSSVDSSKAPVKNTSATFSFGSSSPAFGSGGNLFSSPSFSSPSTTLFGGTSNVKSGSTASIFGGASNLNLGTTPSSLFGGTNSSNSTTTIFGGTSSSNQVPASSSIFGGSSSKATSATPTFGSLFGAGTASAGLGSTAVNSPSTAFPILGSLTTASKEEKSEKSEGVSFLPVGNSPSFASLAAANPSGNVFKLGDTNNSNKSFAFDGAGSKVFGGVSSVTPSKKNNEEEGDSGGEHDTTEVETHDPHFEPIIAMPDIVEVRTGEEDEEKVFCRRAKLFRYDGKEWKERGVGEMKILKHPVNGTFRLLLRREQVYKVVLNQRLHPDMELVRLNTSDKAWCWGGINHAEEPEGVLEKLAVRFKNAEEADEFHQKLEECRKMIMKVPGEVVKDGGHEDEEEEDDEDDDDYEDDENAYEDDEGEFEILFEKPAALVSEIEGVENSVVEGKGAIRIILQPNHSYVVEMEDVSGQALCRAPITGDVEVSRNKTICTWKSFDHDEDYDQGIDKKFVVTFENEEDAESFQDYYSKYTLEIVERSYDYVDEQED